MKKFSLEKMPILLVAIIFCLVSPAHGESLDLIGWAERVTIVPENISIKAKVDTGAKNSSLHCDCSSTFQKNGEEWVTFTLTNDKGKKTVISRKVVRTSTIKRHFGMRQKRYVIKLAICLGGKTREVEVSLVNREGFNYQMLLGRTFIQGQFVIDPSKKYLVKKKCDTAKK